MALQYPPGRTRLRRFGFGRDAIHFWYLCRSFIESERPADWTAPPNVRFSQVMGDVRGVRNLVKGDNSINGQLTGSVSDIDEHYGVDALTLDSKEPYPPPRCVAYLSAQARS